MTAGRLYGSSNTLVGISQVIRKFYAGEQKELSPIGEFEWSVHNLDGKKLSTCVRYVKGRYRFEGPASE